MPCYLKNDMTYFLKKFYLETFFTYEHFFEKCRALHEKGLFFMRTLNINSFEPTHLWQIIFGEFLISTHELKLGGQKCWKFSYQTVFKYLSNLFTFLRLLKRCEEHEFTAYDIHKMRLFHALAQCLSVAISTWSYLWFSSVKPRLSKLSLC